MSAEVVPGDCVYAMKHLLCTEDEGVVLDMPRRSGKTTAILNKAIRLAKSGLEVIIFVPTSEYAHRIQQNLMGTGVQVASVGGWRVDKQKAKTTIRNVLAGQSTKMVLSDEIQEWIAEFVKQDARHCFILGCYSSKG